MNRSPHGDQDTQVPALERARKSAATALEPSRHRGSGRPARGARRSQDERGAVLLLSVFFITALMISAAFVLDLGRARDVRGRSQNAADASALAAALAIYDATGKPDLAAAIKAAKGYALANFDVTDTDWATCTDPGKLTYTVPGAPACISFDNATRPTKVRVRIPVRRLSALFGGFTDVDQFNITAVARAAIDPGVHVDCGLCFLSDVDSGNADYTVNGGSIAVNGDTSLGAQGHMTVTGAGAYVAIVGAYQANQGYSPKPVIAIPSFSDPLATLALPVGKSGLATHTNPCETTGKKGTVTPGEGPGIYGNVSITGTCTLEPGLYVITGTWDLKNNTVLTNKPGGVTLYFTCGTPTAPAACAPGSYGGQLFGKNGTVKLTARPADPVKDVAVVYDRENQQSLQLQGNGDSFIDGTIYLRNGDLEFNGNSCFTINRGPVVAASVIKANGNKTCVTVTNSKSATVADLPGDIHLDE